MDAEKRQMLIQFLTWYNAYSLPTHSAQEMEQLVDEFIKERCR